MNKTTMSKVTECEVTDCAYNKHNSCHTLAITVGGPEDCSHCDTYVTATRSGGIPDVKAGVGACKVSICVHNQSLECAANKIKVGWHENHPDCKTFHPR